jgi:uncharacterized protein YhbP (UPF0306 family)
MQFVSMNPWNWLDQHNVLNLGTVGPDGPWSAAVYFARDGKRFIFLSARHSKHASNLAADPRCSATINGDARAWSNIRGVQLSGRVRRLDGAEAEASRGLYFLKFTDMLSKADETIQAALKRIDWYELVPDRMLFVDNSRGFGYREVVT